MANPRKTAFNILQKVEKDLAYSNLTINNEIKSAQLDKRDAAFTSAVVYGVLERKLTLDYIIRQYVNIRLKKIEKPVLILLRMGVYQILFMDKVPESAAVNESVKLAKQLKLYKSSGFINGVLRSVVRNNGRYRLPDKDKDKVLYYSVLYSCPENLVKLWINSYGEDRALNILKNLSGKPPVTVRVNTLKTTPDALKNSFEQLDINVSKTNEENALILDNTGAIDELPLYKQGLFHVQDLASQLCCKLLSPKEGQTVYDFCSAPGGKGFTIAQLMNNSGKIKAFDLYDHKVKLIKYGAERLGINIIDAEVRDALSYAPLDKADRVLCDVPCSGLGIIRRKPEIRYKKEAVCNELPKLQYKILCNCSQYVKSQGVLVYSTCTLNPEENEKNTERFLKEHTDFVPVSIELKGYDNAVIKKNTVTLFPCKNGTDGFFIGVFKRNN